MTKQENKDNRHRPNVPPLRFRGFTAPWQRKRIDQLYEEGTERGERGLLLSVSISSGVNVTDSFTKTRTVTDFSNYKVVHKGSIVYNTMRMWQGASGVSNYEGYVSPAYTVANPLESVSSTFFSYLLKNESLIHQFKINSQGLCSDTWTLKFPEFGRMEIGIPSLAEQEKIGTFFRALDELIAAREEELEKLRQMKAALLEAMFPNDASVERERERE